MNVIWKYPLEITGRQTVAMPVGSEILSAQLQHGLLVLWAIGDSSNTKTDRYIEVIGTGNPISKSDRAFIGTVQRGALVWHIFELL